jgi:hypothetical protein
MITLILTYYDNPGMLEQHWMALRELPSKLRHEINVIVVDDGSPRWPAEIVGHEGVVRSARLFRVDVDVRWNQDACRNIGMHQTATKWNLLTDIDHLVPADTWAVLLSKPLDPDTIYKFARREPDGTPYKPHPNSWLLTREVYWKAGGYDERFAGWYGTDGDFRNRVALVGPIVQLKEPLIRVGREHVADASTTTYERKTLADRTNIDRIKKEREAEGPDWMPKTMSFPYHEVGA